jgi:uncharacterized phage protein (TIGR01671 family)
MNREISFKAWDYHLSKFVDFNLIGRVDFNDPTYEFLQYTGLKDKNGEKIYSGDLINFTLQGYAHGPESEDIKKAEVFWDDKNACFSFGRYMTNEYMEYSFCLGDRIDRNSLEVVGNIFNNLNRG